VTKEHILREIRRTAEANGGRPLGFRTFEQETGVRYADWFGRYWRSWGDAVREAGFEPNVLQSRISDAELLERFVQLARDLGRVPVKGDMRLKRRDHPGFPSDKVFERFGGKRQLVSRAREYCLSRADLEDALGLFSQPAIPEEPETPLARPAAQPTGFVYLIRFGRYYKIGRTNSAGRRERELAIQLPEKSRTVHTITTDDPEGIEAYWHKRFASKRAHGEWFKLEQEDVIAFKRRRFQ
jgi:Meiotically up-regulated gene 113/Homing endonuclease associated repeat